MRWIAGNSPWTVSGTDAGALRGLAEKIDKYAPNGGTNLYGCLSRAVAELRKPQEHDRKRLVVLMSDGLYETRERMAAVRALT